MIQFILKNRVYIPFVPLYTALVFSILHKGGIGYSANFISIIAVISFLILLLVLKRNDLVSPKFNVLSLSAVLTIILIFSYNPVREGVIMAASLIAGLLLFSGISSVSLKETQITTFLGKILSLSMLSTVIGILFYLFLPFEKFAGSFYNLLEPWSAFPNAYGDLIVLTLPLALYFSHFRKSVATTIISTLLMTGMILTQSSGITIALVLILISTYFLTRNARLLTLTLVGAIVLSVVLFSVKELNDYDYREPVGQNLETFEQSVSVNTRLDHYKTSLNLLKNVSFEGYGVGTYKYVSAPHLHFLNTAEHPHNILLKLLLETGPLFTTLICLLILATIICGFKNSLVLEKFIIVGLTTFLLHQMIDDNTAFASVWLVFWFLLGLISRKVDSEFPKVNLFVYGLSIAFLLFLICPATQSKLPSSNLAEFFEKSGDYKSARVFNPHNIFYSLGVYESATPQEQEVLEKSLTPMLENYASLLNLNTNLTILTDNPETAIALASRMNNYELSERLRSIYSNELSKFLKTFKVSSID